MDTLIAPGDLVFLTPAYEKWVYERNPQLQVSLVNRLAKVEEVIDWDSEKGKRIKEVRLKSGKWKDLPLEDNKYLLSIYYHDLVGRNDKPGIIEPTPMFSKDPKTGAPFFIKVPEWLLEKIMDKCKSFEVEVIDDQKRAAITQSSQESQKASELPDVGQFVDLPKGNDKGIEENKIHDLFE